MVVIIPEGVSEGNEFDVEMQIDGSEMQISDDDDNGRGQEEGLSMSDGDDFLGDLETLLDDNSDDDGESVEVAAVEFPSQPKLSELATPPGTGIPPSRRRYSVSLVPGAMDSLLAVVDLPAPMDTVEERGEDIVEQLTTLDVVLPDGIGPGELLYIQYDDTELSVTIPEGVGPGDTFQVTVDGDSAANEQDEGMRST